MTASAFASLTGVFQKEWFVGFLSGVAATVLGFVFTIIWDLYKMRRDERDRAATVARAIGEELAENAAVSDQNLLLLNHELGVLAQGQSVVQPLRLLATGFWDVAKINLPKALSTGDRLLKLRNLVALADACNEQIRSRENYRIHNAAMTNFPNRLRLYDESLVQTLTALRVSITEYQGLP